jgi:hypothetical protein
VSVETLSFFAASFAESQTATLMRPAGPAATEVFFMPFLFGGDSSGDVSESQADVEQTVVSARNNAKP